MSARGLAVLLLAVAVLLSLPRSAAAETRVVVVGADGNAAPAGLVEALRVQLLRDAAVEAGPSLHHGTLADQVAEATAALDARDATLVVWLHAAPPDGGEHELFVVARRRSRALLVVTQVPRGDARETDRALALKIHEVVDEVLAERASGEGLTSLVVGDAPLTMSPTGGEEVAPRLAFVAEAGGTIVTGGASAGGVRPGAVVGGGGRIASARFAGEVLIEATFLDGIMVKSPVGVARARESDLAGDVRALARLGALSVGGGLRAGVHLLDAAGLSTDGGRGSAERTLPFIGVAPELRIAPIEHLEIRAAAGADVATRRQRFSIHDRSVIDLPPARAQATISLVAWLP